MNRPNNPGCGCNCGGGGGGTPCSHINVTVHGCSVNGDDALAGASCTLTSGGVTISSGTTDAMGNFGLLLYATGTYTLTITATGYTAFTSTGTFSCGPDTHSDIYLTAPENVSTQCCNESPPTVFPYLTLQATGGCCCNTCVASGVGVGTRRTFPLTMGQLSNGDGTFSANCSYTSSILSGSYACPVVTLTYIGSNNWSLQYSADGAPAILTAVVKTSPVASPNLVYNYADFPGASGWTLAQQNFLRCSLPYVVTP